MSGSRTAERRSRLAAALDLDRDRALTPAERRLAGEIEKGLDRVEATLRGELAFADGVASVTGRYLLDAGGKRVRPVLALLTAEFGRGGTDEVIKAATAVEIIHLASLYHDDVMDGATLRRGVPSAQSVWGNSVAVITGDLLFARAVRIIADLGEQALRAQAETFERLCLGQLHETLGPAEGADPVEHYLGVLADKTGSLIAAAAEAGVRFSDAPEELIAPVRRFGEEIGVAFQIVDDIIDLSPGSERTGKLPGADLRQGVATLPLLYLREEANGDPVAAGLVARIEGGVEAARAGTVDEPAFQRAIAELREHPVTARARDEARRYGGRAVAALATVPDGPVRAALVEFADRLVERGA